MTHPSALILVALLTVGWLPTVAAAQKPRVLVLTDIENEPDDAMSMVRFLIYANQWDVEGLVATTSTHQKDKTAAWRIRQIVEAYGKVRDNLEKHEPGYPTAEYLLSIIREGRPAFGMAAVGAGMDSPGSDRIIEVVDRDDPRPVWVSVWGGPNCLAQALWKVRATRSSEALQQFVGRLRVYTISDQDDSGPWLRKTFPALFYIASPGIHAGGAYHHATWTGISGDRFHGRFSGADFSLVDNPWLDRNIRSKGPLGAQHPQTTFLMEGDTPSFLYLVGNGLGDPEHPDWGSWGGRYELYTPRTSEVVPGTGEPAVLVRRRGRSVRHRRQLAHEQQGDDLALARRVSERLRRAHGLDHQALRRSEPPASGQARPSETTLGEVRRARKPQRQGFERSRRPRPRVRVVLLRRAGHTGAIDRAHGGSADDRGREYDRRVAYRTESHQA